MIIRMQIILIMTAAVTIQAAFLQAPTNHFQLPFNSTFLNGSERLFKPIIIPNTTRNDHPQTSKLKLQETHRTKANELILKQILQPEESTLKNNFLGEQPKATKFSSRYSTKHEDLEKAQPEGDEKLKEDDLKTTQTSHTLEEEHDTSTEIHKSFINDSSEEKEDSELKEAEESGFSPTTSETYAESQGPTSFRKEDFGSYEKTEETDSSEEDEKENRRSVEDYDNSGSKNYHSIQTPLNKIKYRGPLYDFESEKIRTRLVSPISRRPSTHNWPYSRGQIKTELEKVNEISDENYEEALDEGINEEVKTKPKNSDLELAVEKDEFKFDRSKKYNYIEERNRRKQQQKALIAEEEKDERTPLFTTIKHYQVDEERGKPKKKEGVWSTNPPHITTPKNKPQNSTPRKPTVSTHPTNFPGNQFLGPVVFSQDTEQPTTKPLLRKGFQPKKQARPVPKGLSESEKLDQENLSNQRFQKSIFGTGSRIAESFNHVEEINEMYNAILANIQSVFAVRKPLKSSSQKGIPEGHVEESKSLTWSLPLKREKVN